MYKGRYFIREKTYECGDYLDVEVYPVFQKPGKRRSKCKPTSDIQKRQNQRNAEKVLTRTAHLNFTNGDIALHLTYKENPIDYDRAIKDLRNFFDRVNRLRHKLGLPKLKYISCTEVSGTGRIHHHIIMSGGIDRDTLERVWRKGLSNSRRLQFGDDGITGLTRYMVKDGKIQKGKKRYKRWNASRNLIKPEPIIKDNDVTTSDVKHMERAIERKSAHAFFEDRHQGWELISAEYEQNAINRGNYVTYAMRRHR
ncbi:MAG: hypothetical protein FWG69_06330 [Oscillospiraceae bacterium]|nr:hypothetical protein [Oscillospiraceae bacterium]